MNPIELNKLMLWQCKLIESLKELVDIFIDNIQDEKLKKEIVFSMDEQMRECSDISQCSWYTIITLLKEKDEDPVAKYHRISALNTLKEEDKPVGRFKMNRLPDENEDYIVNLLKEECANIQEEAEPIIKPKKKQGRPKGSKKS